jgi:hypothetical protein
MASRNELRVTKLSACVLLAAAPFAGRTRTKATASAQPWYIFAAAIHRVMLNPHGQYESFEHLAMDTTMRSSRCFSGRIKGSLRSKSSRRRKVAIVTTGSMRKIDLGLIQVSAAFRDFERLVAQAHHLGIRIITFQSLGYSSVDAPQLSKQRTTYTGPRHAGKQVLLLEQYLNRAAAGHRQ